MFLAKQPSNKRMVRMPGIEPGSDAWEAPVLTVRLHSQRTGYPVIHIINFMLQKFNIFILSLLFAAILGLWSSGYDVAFTRRRPPVRSRPGLPSQS